MPSIESLDPTQNGRPPEDLQKKLGRPIVEQEEAVRQIGRAYQTHVVGLPPVRSDGRRLVEGRDFKYCARHLKTRDRAPARTTIV
jgi:hypothetical protein